MVNILGTACYNNVGSYVVKIDKIQFIFEHVKQRVFMLLNAVYMPPVIIIIIIIIIIIYYNSVFSRWQ